MNTDNSIEWLLSAYRQHPSETQADLQVQVLVERLRDPVRMQQLVGQSASDSLDPLVERHFGDFKLIGHVGSGGMGQVFRAVHKKLGRTQALKLLPPGRVTNDQAMKRFEREMLAIGKLNHPSVVTVYDAGHVDGTPYLAMELVEGKTLAQVVQESKLNGNQINVSDACRWIAEAADGIQHAHDNNVYHRDIKPANLMLDNFGKVKVLDLGLAKFSSIQNDGGNPGNPLLEPDVGLNSLTADHQILGTPDFMAPEQINGEPDQRTDVYSLAATLHYLLTGDVLFREAKQGFVGKAIAVAQQTAPSAKQRRSEITESLDNLLQRALSKSPEDRPQSAAKFATLLRQFAESGTTQVNEVVSASKEQTKRLKQPAISSREQDSRNRISKWWLALAPILLGLLGIVLVIRGPDGATLTIKCDDPNIKVTAEWLGEGNAPTNKPTTHELGKDSTAKLITGPWRIQIVGDLAGKVELSENEFVLIRGEEKVLTITSVEGPSIVENPENTELAERTSRPFDSTPETPSKVRSSASINLTNYTPPSQRVLAAYADVLPRTGLIPREIIRPGLPLEGIQKISYVNSGHYENLMSPSAVSPSGRYFAWLTGMNDAVVVKDLTNNKFIQFTAGRFRSARWSSSPDKRTEDANLQPIEHLILTPRDQNQSIEIRLPNGRLVRQFKTKGWFSGQSFYGDADVNPIPDSECLLLWSAKGAAVFDRDGKIGASIESEMFSKMFASDYRNCGRVAILKTGDNASPWKFLFTSSDEIIRCWQPGVHFEESESPAATASPIELDLENAARDGEIEEWFKWEEDESPIVPSFIAISPDHRKILLSSDPKLSPENRTLILGTKQERLANAEFSERFAFDPSSNFLVDGKGRIYSSDLVDQQAIPEFNSDDTEEYPDLVKIRKQPFWTSESTIHLATLFNTDGALLLAGSPAKEFRLISKAPAASASYCEFTSDGDLGISALIAPSSSGGGSGNRVYFATIDSNGNIKRRTVVNRVGASTPAQQSLANGNLLFSPSAHEVDLMSGDKVIKSFKDVSRWRWSPSGKQFVIGDDKEGSPGNLTFYDLNGEEIQKIVRHPQRLPYPYPSQDRWSNDGRFFIECAYEDEETKQVTPIIYDLKTGRKIELSPHRFDDPIDCSADSKWLSVRRNRKHGSLNFPSPNITIVDLETSEQTESTIKAGNYRDLSPPFAFSPQSNQAVTLDGVYEISSNGVLRKVAPLKLPSHKTWEIAAVVKPNDQLATNENSLGIKILVLGKNEGARQSFSWVAPGENPVWRPLNPGYGSNNNTIRAISDSEKGIIGNTSNHCLSLLPVDPDHPTRFLRMFLNHSVLSFDEFGQVNSQGLKSDANDYMVRTLNYSGGRVIPLNEEDYLTRIAATHEEKLEYWLIDLGIEYRKVDGEIVEVIARDLAELSGTDLDFVSRLPHLQKLTIVGCPKVRTLPQPTKNLESLTDLTVGKIDLTQALPEFLARFPNLENLDITETNYPHLFVSNIIACKKLKTLRASKKLLTESVIRKIASNLPDCKIDATK